ncbi:hypothetical protein CQA86_32580, partial [Klebsiella pneumoniae]
MAQHPQITVVDGGAERADSVLAGLQAIAVSPGDRRFSQLPLAQHPQITVVDGGAERADSVLAGLQA